MFDSHTEHWCDKCNLQFSNYLQYKSHCDGDLHAENVLKKSSTSSSKSRIKSSNALTYSKEEDFPNNFYRQVHQDPSSMPTFTSNMTTSFQQYTNNNSFLDTSNSSFLFSNPPQDLTLGQIDMIFKNGNLYQNFSQPSHQHSSHNNDYQTTLQSNKMNFPDDKKQKHADMSQQSYTPSHSPKITSEIPTRKHATFRDTSSNHHQSDDLNKSSSSREQPVESLPTLSEIFNVLKQNDKTKREELENKLDRYESRIHENNKIVPKSTSQNEQKLSDQLSNKSKHGESDKLDKKKYSFKVKESTNKNNVVSLIPLDERKESHKSLLGKYKPTNNYASRHKTTPEKHDRSYKMKSDDAGIQAKAIFDSVKKESQRQNVDRNMRDRLEKHSSYDSRRSTGQTSLRDDDFRVRSSVADENRRKTYSTSDRDERSMYTRDRRSSTQTSTRAGRDNDTFIPSLMDLGPEMNKQLLSRRSSSNLKTVSPSLKRAGSRDFSRSSRNETFESLPSSSRYPDIDKNNIHPLKPSSHHQPKRDHDYRSSPPHKKSFIDYDLRKQRYSDNNKSPSEYMDYETKVTVALFRETLMKVIKESLVFKELNKEDVYLLNNLSLSELRLLRGVQGLVDISSARKILDIVKIIRTLDPTISQMLVNEGKVLQKDGKCLMPQKALSPRDVGPPLLCHLILLIRLHDRDVEGGKNRN